MKSSLWNLSVNKEWYILEFNKSLSFRINKWRYPILTLLLKGAHFIMRPREVPEGIPLHELSPKEEQGAKKEREQFDALTEGSPQMVGRLERAEDEARLIELRIGPEIDRLQASRRAATDERVVGKIDKKIQQGVSRETERIDKEFAGCWKKFEEALKKVTKHNPVVMPFMDTRMKKLVIEEIKMRYNTEEIDKYRLDTRAKIGKDHIVIDLFPNNSEYEIGVQLLSKTEIGKIKSPELYRI